jgi:hypothetical protein
MGGCFLSRRDSTIEAWHEVPGIMRKIGFVPAGRFKPFNDKGWIIGPDPRFRGLSFDDKNLWD